MAMVKNVFILATFLVVAVLNIAFAEKRTVIEKQGDVTVSKIYLDDGKLDRILRSVNGKLHGIAEVYDMETGKLKEKWTYDQGIIVAVKHFDGEGNITKEFTFKEETNGNQKTVYKYYANGKLDRILRYVDDRLEGLAEVYDPETGRLSDEYIYKNGEIIEHIEK